MNTNKHYRQALESDMRKARRAVAADVAKKAGSNRIAPTPHVNLGFQRGAKGYEMPVS